MFLCANSVRRGGGTVRRRHLLCRAFQATAQTVARGDGCFAPTDDGSCELQLGAAVWRCWAVAPC
eukprot:10880988-Alexandrium_andersonii.AAC.1